MIRRELSKLSGSGGKAFLGVVVAMSLYLLAANPILARAESDRDRGEPAESPRVSLPLQRGFFNGATALYITPEVGLDPTSTALIATAKQIAKGFNSNFIPQNFATLAGSPAVDDIFVVTNSTRETCWPLRLILRVPQTPIRTTPRYGKSARSPGIPDAGAGC